MKLKYKSIKSIYIGVALATLVIGFASCGKKDANSPGVEFAPDMYRSPSVEVYGTSVFNGDTIYSQQFLPVKGTIARGYMPYVYPNTSEGYEQAGLYLKNPIALNEKVMLEAEALYGKYCLHCHGVSGAGDGKVSDKLPGAPPAYNGALKNLSEGKIFHSITYGKGLMGNHANILSQDERWKLVHYVQRLQGPKEAAPTDSAKVATTITDVKKEETKSTH
ncbi:MAG TPA: cytochrome c [Bacteroidia bacterium]|nr:cytochrome c [Bacteroidia bacterium]HRD39374.1 cytochrome c [Bacteroidia bacterium]